MEDPPATHLILGTLRRTPRGRTVRCARTARKVGYFGPVFTDGQGGRGKKNTMFPDTGLPQIHTQSKKPGNESEQTVLHIENARLLPKSAVFAL